MLSEIQIQTLVSLLENANFDGECDVCWEEQRKSLVEAFPELESHLPKTKYPVYESDPNAPKKPRLTLLQVSDVLKDVWRQRAIEILEEESPLLKVLKK